MTPSEITAIVNRYQGLVATGSLDVDTWATELAKVKAAWARYEETPPALFLLGQFAIASGALVVIDAHFSDTRHACVHVNIAKNGNWTAFVAVEVGMHVGLFVYHVDHVPITHPTAYDLVKQRQWQLAGVVPIDTATCAIADSRHFTPRGVEDSRFYLDGIGEYGCFSNSANADGGYEVFASSEDGQVVAVYVQFFAFIGEPQEEKD